MQNDFDRAKQFMPFDALKGFRETIKLMEKTKFNKSILLDDNYDYLNSKIKLIKKGSKIRIKYFNNLEYIETIDIVKNLDYTFKKIYLINSVINIEDIIDIEII